MQANQKAPPKSNIEMIMENFITNQTHKNKEFMNQIVHVNELITQLGNKVIIW